MIKPRKGWGFCCLETRAVLVSGNVGTRC
jgi:hypothetical protein